MCSDSGSSCSGNGSDSEDGKWAPCLGSAAERLARRPCARESSGGAPQVACSLRFPLYCLLYRSADCQPDIPTCTIFM